jgi:methyl-accepting chemotaxis protein
MMMTEMEMTGLGKSKRGLRFKFIVLVNSLLVAMGLIIGMILLIGIKNSYEDQLQKRGLSLANNIATNGLFAITTEDTSLLESMLKGVLQESDVRYIIILNEEGKVISHSDGKEIGKASKDPFTLRALKVTQSSVFPYSQNSERFYDVVAPVTLKGANASNGKRMGIIRLGISLKDLDGELRKFFLITLSVLGVLISLGVFISLISAQIIITPLERMTDVAVKIAAGDFRQTIEVKSQDEVGILGKALAQMSGSLKEMIKKIQVASQQITTIANQTFTNTTKVSDGAVHQTKATKLTSASIEEMTASVRSISENMDSLSSSALTTSSSIGGMSAAINQVASTATALSSSVEETTSSIVQMSASIKQVAENIGMLSTSSEEITSSITEMNVSIKEVGKNAKESAVLSEKVSQDATELGIDAIEKTIKGMEKIKKSVDQSSYVISKLDERTEQIGKILTVIDDVTRQTNLLALNAAILAAQAGNEGKGFAVVADEIKSLADRTSTSTKDISQLIKDVQSEAKDAVVSVKEGAKSVEEGVHLSINARTSLGKILVSSKRSAEMSRQIEQAAIEQVKATNQVNQLMEKMNVMVQQISAAMQEMGKVTGYVIQASGKMRSMTEQVKLSAEEQNKGSQQISEAVANVTERIQQIGQSMNEHKKESQVIMSSILEIHQVTQESMQKLKEMSEAVQGLTNQADILKEGVSHFKFE